MKTRLTFVSNSSSSSCVVCGYRMKKEDLAAHLKIEVDEEDYDCRETALLDEISYKINSKMGLTAEDTKNYFSDTVTDDLIIGVEILSPEDGCITELPPVNYQKIKEEIEEKLGIKFDTDPTIWFQYIGNDNY